jgi:hypothetical protein
MTHPRIEELVARFQAARKLGEVHREEPRQLRLHRELVHDCPAYTPNLLRLARLLQLVDEPEVEAEAGFTEIQRLLELAVEGSERGAPALVELGYFLDVIRDQPEAAFACYAEGAARSLETLEDAWVGMLRHWTLQRTADSLRQALQLGELAEKLLPQSERLQRQVHEARTYARLDGLLDSQQG